MHRRKGWINGNVNNNKFYKIFMKNLYIYIYILYIIFNSFSIILNNKIINNILIKIIINLLIINIKIYYKYL